MTHAHARSFSALTLWVGSSDQYKYWF